MNRLRRRVSQNKVVMPSVTLALVSFAVFWIKPESGERLGYGITLILAEMALDIVVADNLPVCDEWLWVRTRTRSYVAAGRRRAWPEGVVGGDLRRGGSRLITADARA